MKNLFDETSGFLLMDEIVFENPHYQAIIKDKVITDDEIMEQANRVIMMFKMIDQQLNPEDKKLVMNTISELAVLYAIHATKGGKNNGSI